ncbi:hypothetical protein OG777_19935 [Micromonospora peucetia]|uniref:Uncharacterized protein n=1 Tax=Micromonospora peucetia TaxID=47871 RepID=A0A1C6V5A4_9ACTN|nr:hypothetical protein [Micromonospora peucetia]MCX4389182.1 hypothetical protein [Micromonospora peucetia]WSA35376.1 hypothetical protein OIE14_15685 [Micromonospora peucetia]SCL61357.1 hypothetical protein GA0070608_2459 [Micromonospora peucetia]
MRGGLDETLARMARREEALRRRAAEAEAAGGEAVTSAEAQGGSDPGRTETRGEGRNAGPGWADTRRGAEPRDPVAEVAEAVRRVVAGHPGTAVSIRVEHDGQAYPLRVVWTDSGVTVDVEAAAPPPAWPMSVKTVPAWTPTRERLTPDPAARLAELIRRDPSLLGAGDPSDRARNAPGSGAA